MATESAGVPDVTEKKCPKCGSDLFAWVSSEGDKDTFECRKCKTLFSYRGDW